jgi:hypothetical protein
MKKKRSKVKNLRLKYKRKEPPDAEALARVLFELAAEHPSEDQTELIEAGKAIVKQIEAHKMRAS